MYCNLSDYKRCHIKVFVFFQLYLRKACSVVFSRLDSYTFQLYQDRFPLIAQQQMRYPPWRQDTDSTDENSTTVAGNATIAPTMSIDPSVRSVPSTFGDPAVPTRRPFDLETEITDGQNQQDTTIVTENIGKKYKKS